MENLAKESELKQLRESYDELMGIIQEQQRTINAYKVNDFYNHLEWCWKVMTVDCGYLTEEFKKGQAEVFMKLLTPKENESTGESR